MNYGEMLDQVRRAGGMDVDPGLAGSWVNNRYKRLAVESGWSRAMVLIGDTVANQQSYALPDNVTEVHELRVGGTPYRRTGVQTMWDLEADYVGIAGDGGVFAPDFSEDGANQVALYPVPTTSGDDIEALATVTPPDLNQRDVPAIPDDFHQRIVEGAMADAFALIDENIPVADRYEQRYEAAIEALRRRRNRRVGGGPHSVQIEGVHYQR